jgi:hypothetical protein
MGDCCNMYGRRPDSELMSAKYCVFGLLDLHKLDL